MSTVQVACPYCQHITVAWVDPARARPGSSVVDTVRCDADEDGGCDALFVFRVDFPPPLTFGYRIEGDPDRPLRRAPE